MRRLLTLLLLLTAGISVLATNSGSRRAAARLGTDVVLAAQAAGDNPTYYVYNATTAGQGFVVMSADDEVLAYSHRGRYDDSDVPPALRHWLQTMDRQERLLREGRARRRATEERAAIDPLITTQWDQLAPYNLLAPDYVSGQQAPTGCLATAMAQLLKYYSYDEEVKAMPAYTTKTHGIYRPALPATQFDYASMQDAYSSADKSASAMEVARLMQYCGQAVSTDYSDASGAEPLLNAFSTYFGYNAFAYYAERYQYPAWAWEKLIYSQLAAGHPVLMTGQAFSSVGLEGHAFLCDGYDGAGFYHMNWGWGGDYDAWYRLEVCNPFGQGTGGSHGLDGFSIDQAAMINVFPESLPSDVRLTVSAFSVVEPVVTRNNVNDDFTFTVSTLAYNFTAGTMSYDVAIGLYENEDQITGTWTVTRGASFAPYTGLSFLKSLAFGEGISSGQYVARVVCRHSGTSNWLWGYNGDLYLLLSIDGNTLTVSTPEPDLVINSVAFEGTGQAGSRTTMHLNVTNRGRTLYNNLYLFANDQPATGTGLNLDPGQTGDVTLHFRLAETMPLLKLFTGYEQVAANEYEPSGTLLWTGTMRHVDRDPQLTVENIVVANRTYYEGKTAISSSNFRQTATLRNNDTLPFDGDVVAYLFKNTDGGEWFSYDSFDSRHVVIPAGSTADVDFAFDDLDVGARYLTQLNTYYTTGLKMLEHSQTYAYQILGDASAVNMLPATGSNAPAPLFDLQGRRIARPAGKGVYICKGKKIIQ